MGSITALLAEELGYDPGRHPGDDAPELAELADVPVGAMVRARDGARPVAVARLASGRLVVVDDRCPHDGGRISDGFVDGDRLVCARHGWELEVRGGRALRPEPAGACGRICKLRE